MLGSEEPSHNKLQQCAFRPTHHYSKTVTKPHATKTTLCSSGYKHYVS